MFIKTLAATCVMAACAWAPLPTFAAVSVWVQTAPPEARIERMPEARHGYQWVPGYWDWNGRRHMWRTGTWVRDRNGYAYASPTWVENQGKWQLRRGHWSRRDRDGDGVPNNQDRRPDDPNRR